MSEIVARMLPEPTVRIFSDFDGTISPRDIGEELFRFLCGDREFEETIERWRSGALSGVEMYRRLARTASPFTDGQLQEFLQPFRVDATFPGFVKWCDEKGYPLTILSDGFDAYIGRVLEKDGLSVPLRCNRMTFEGTKLLLEFPFADERCPRLGNCKANHVALMSRDEDLIVYIGDGRSDFEAAALADLVFARGSLETHCQEENITFRRFYDFNDVRIVLSTLLGQGTLRRRKRAEVLRKQLWMSG